ncbi:MAG: FAD-dependent monooxygenase [Krumholzibacteria bacterium]|nr:FAD-dependent monooxygenase [Candidatus Krumholzibacteria bacterium]
MQNTNLLAGRRIAVMGAGLVGSLCAVHLARHGAAVTLLEKRPDLRHAAIPGGRSIAMSLSHRGFHALATVDLEARVRAAAKPKTRRCVHLPTGGTQVQEYGRDGQALWTVNRKELNCILLDAAQAAGVRLLFATAGEDLDVGTAALRLRGPGGEARAEAFDHVIGADGLFSQVRAALRAAGVLDESVTTIAYRYFELLIPALPGGGFRLDDDCVHIWPRPEGLFVALPNPNGTFTGTLFFAKDGDSLFRDDRTAAERAAGFAAAFPQVAELSPDHAALLAANPPSDISTVRCTPWHAGDKVCLIGDACHAIVPFYAMGMNTGFEDVTVLDGLIRECGGDLGAVFARFSAERKPCTDAISDLSLRNFLSIGRSADPRYHERWQLERRIWERFPDRWMPLYAMIHFSRRPLDQVIAAAARQNQVLDGLMATMREPQDHLRLCLDTVVAPLLDRTG